MSTPSRLTLALVLVALIAGWSVSRAAASRDAAFGPPWVSIELPANPHDRTTRGAFLLLNAFHHGTPMGFPVTGRAEGLVDGQRRSVNLTLDRTSRNGVYALRKQWPDAGEWTLVLSVAQGENAVAVALVKVSAGEVIGVRVPAEERSGWQVPRQVTQAEIEASLRDRPTRVARAGK